MPQHKHPLPPKPRDPHWLAELRATLGTISHRLEHFERTMMAFIDDLEKKLAAEKTVDDSILALLQTVEGELAAAVQALKDAGVDPARQQAALDALQAEADRISAAVTANTPAEPPVR